MRRFVIWGILATLLLVWAYSDRLFPAEIIRAETATIRDGDTLLMNHVAYRIYGIDAPEYHQLCKDKLGREWECGKAARLQMAALAQSGSIECTPQAEDRYGRKVAKCASATVPDLGEAIVQAGLAISPAERGTAPYADAEESARSAKRGIWQGSFDTPADWRTAHPRAVE
jgi:endonuclease YncB( thermonuclease family)